MNEQETRSEFKRQIRLLMNHSTPKERRHIRRLLIKSRLSRFSKNAFRWIAAVLKCGFGNSKTEKCKV